MLCARIRDCMDLAVYAPVAEAAGNENAVRAVQDFFRIIRCDSFRVRPLDVDGDVVGNTAVFQGFHHGNPVRKIRFRTGKMKAFAGNMGRTLFLHSQRSFVKVFYIRVLSRFSSINHS